MNQNWELLRRGIPKAPDWKISWNDFEQTPIGAYLKKMQQTDQSPFWHGEGDVLTHTKMVCEELAKDNGFRELPERKQEMVFLAALLHDIGKIPCTKLEEGEWISPNHTIVGSKMARELLWKEFGLCGEEEKLNIRECICTLIRYHSAPMHLIEESAPEKRLFKIAVQGKLAKDFSLSLLHTLVRADLRGRIFAETQKSLETAELCFLVAEEENIMEAPGKFGSDVTEYAYLSDRQVWKEQELYDDTWGEVILMSGLPGTGKDTWIQKHYAELPMISLDEIRKELKIAPAESQGKVIGEARERAKEFLRKKQPFVWNATNLSSMIRGKQITLFEQYKARVRIVYLETSWEEMRRRNCSRNAEVPEKVIERMLKDLEVPERKEARNVEWHCV